MCYIMYNIVYLMSIAILTKRTLIPLVYCIPITSPTLGHITLLQECIYFQLELYKCKCEDSEALTKRNVCLAFSGKATFYQTSFLLSVKANASFLDGKGEFFRLQSDEGDFHFTDTLLLIAVVAFPTLHVNICSAIYIAIVLLVVWIFIPQWIRNADWSGIAIEFKRIRGWEMLCDVYIPFADTNLKKKSSCFMIIYRFIIIGHV